jgi:hypothetical protein
MTTAPTVESNYADLGEAPVDCGHIELIRGADWLHYRVMRFVGDPRRALLHISSSIAQLHRQRTAYSDPENAIELACREARRLASEKLQNEGFQLDSD